MGFSKYLPLVCVLCYCSTLSSNGSEIEQWKRFEIQIENDTWQGNPFDVILEASFTSPSGKEISHQGFYASKNTWKIYFMPDEIGKWKYKAQFAKLKNDTISGNFTCTASDLEPPLRPSGNTWRFQGKHSDFPIIWNPHVSDGKHWGFRSRDVNDPFVQESLRFSDEVVGARFLAIGEIFIAPVDWAKSWPQSAVPYIEGKEGEEFYLPFWDQLNAKMDAARDRNMGSYIMLYSDDALKPDNFGLTPRSPRELRLFRYVMARLSCYPHILWDSGIDLSEYRRKEWVNWYIDWFKKHDPWHHPISSRSGGGSGGFLPAAATYFSTGGAFLPKRAELLEFYNKDVPIAHTDHWRPFISRGKWTNDKIRIAHWRCLLTGAQAIFPDYNQGHVNTQQLEQGANYIRLVNEFIHKSIHSDLSDLKPADRLILEGNNAIVAANPGREYIIYDEDGGQITIDLTSASAPLYSQWFNPRTGSKTDESRINTGNANSFNSPTSKEDWVLHIFSRN